MHDHAKHHHVCPWWVGYFLASPLRKLLQSPVKILAPYLREGMTVLDIGTGMGFFTLPMAKMVGPRGRVIGVDLQPKMLAELQRRAKKAGLWDRIEPVQCSEASLSMDRFKGQADFALAMFVVHEVPSTESFFRELSAAMKANGICLVAEPARRVPQAEFDHSIKTAEEVGFRVIGHPRILKSRAVLLAKVI